MARKREYDEDAAVEAAMNVFWRKGYFATSIDELVVATGASRSGLYSSFESKRGLFLASLDLYRMAVVDQVARVLFEPDASIGAIRQMLESMSEFASRPVGRFGCMLCNTAVELAERDEKAAARVVSYRSHLTNGFEVTLRTAIANGDVDSGFDLARGSEFLSGVTQTLPFLARQGADPRMIRSFVSTSLTLLQSTAP